MQFRGVIVVETRPQGPKEGVSVGGWTYRIDPLCGICREWSAWGVVSAASPLLVRTFYHGNYAVGGVIVERDVTRRGQSPTADSEEPDLGLGVGTVHHLRVALPARSPDSTYKINSKFVKKTIYFVAKKLTN